MDIFLIKNFNYKIQKLRRNITLYGKNIFVKVSPYNIGSDT